MHLSPEQRRLISQYVAAASPSPLCAYSLWLGFGLFGAHHYYLGRRRSGLAMLAAALFGLLLAGLGIVFGGTPADGLFYDPSLSDILRSSQSACGLALFYGGAALIAGLIMRWLLDAFAIFPAIKRRRIGLDRQIIRFYRRS